jgi:hypothetical protein
MTFTGSSDIYCAASLNATTSITSKYSGLDTSYFVGSGAFASWGHKSATSSTNYAILQNSTGANTFLNAGTQIELQIANGPVADFTSSAISLLKNTSVNGTIIAQGTGTAISAPNGDISTGGVYRSGVYAPTANFSIASATSNVVYVNTVGLHLTIPSSGVTPGTVFHLCFLNSTVIDFSGLTLYNNGSTESSGSSWNGNSEYILTCASATAWYIK